MQSSSSSLRKNLLQKLFASFRGSNCCCRRRQERPFSNDSSRGSNKTTTTTREVVDRMRARFQRQGNDKTTNNQAEAETWDSLWKDNTTPWDLGGPTAVLKSELSAHYYNNNIEKVLLPQQQKKCLRTLVPGCGAGYDLVTIAQHHDNLITSGHHHHQLLKDACVVGLDISGSSLERAVSEIEAAFESFTSPFESRRPTRVKLVKGDFFDDPATWGIAYSHGGNDQSLEETTPIASFDLIFDYTFFCALPPSLRPAWGERISDLLVPNTGRLLTLMFPVLEDAEMIGPPYPVEPHDYRQVLEPHGLEMESAPRQSPDTVPQRADMELVAWWRHSVSPSSKL